VARTSQEAARQGGEHDERGERPAKLRTCGMCHRALLCRMSRGELRGADTECIEPRLPVGPIENAWGRRGDLSPLGSGCDVSRPFLDIRRAAFVRV
jgi:hypothetical protein